MGRIRTIKPEFWEDDRVGQLSPLAKLVFIGSWNLADDAGRLRWSADYINASLFMYEKLSRNRVEKLMAEVEAQKLVTPYEARGQGLAHISGWHHQRIDKPQPARFPPPPAVMGSDAPLEDGNDSGNDSGNGTENDDGNDSLQEGKGREGKGSGKGREGGARPDDGGSSFVEFWSVYPRREAKGEATKAWAKAITKADPPTILAAAERYRDDPNRDPAYTAHPTTWLNQGRWEDDPLPPRSGNGNGHAPRDRVAEALVHARANPL